VDPLDCTLWLSDKNGQGESSGVKRLYKEFSAYKESSAIWYNSKCAWNGTYWKFGINEKGKRI
jgi:hypothetical protein